MTPGRKRPYSTDEEAAETERILALEEKVLEVRTCLIIRGLGSYMLALSSSDAGASPKARPPQPTALPDQQAATGTTDCGRADCHQSRCAVIIVVSL